MAENNNNNNTQTEKVVSTVAWIIFFIAMLIPGINLIVILFAAFGPCNLNLKNFCRATLIWMLVGIILSAICSFAAWYAVDNASDSLSHEDILQLIDDGHKALDSLKDGLEKKWAAEGKEPPSVN